MLVVWSASEPGDVLFEGGEGTVVPRTSSWGQQSGEARNTEVLTVRADDFADYCERVARYVAAASELGYGVATFEVDWEMQHRYSGSILLSKENSLKCDQNPSGLLNHVVENELPCLQFDAAFVTVEPTHKLVGYFANSNDGTFFETQYQAHPALRNCSHLHAGTPELSQLVAFLEAAETRGESNYSDPTFLGNLTVSDNPYATAFANQWLRALFVAGGVGMLILAVVACTYAARRWRAAPKAKTPAIMYVVLVINAIAMTALGLVTIKDCGGLCGAVSDSVRNSMRSSFLFTATASDTLLAWLYTEAVHGPSKRKGMRIFFQLAVRF